jgi:hypothetical protein
MIVAIVPLILASSFIFCSLTFCKYLIFTSSPDSAAEIIQFIRPNARKGAKGESESISICVRWETRLKRYYIVSCMRIPGITMTIVYRNRCPLTRVG